MKKYIIVIILLQTTILNAQREVILIHGLGGDLTSWQIYEQEFQNMTPMTNLNLMNGEYDTEKSLPNTAAEVRDGILRRGGTNAETAIVIGHSMGGITARQLDFEHQTGNGTRLFRGIVTSGSPNQGAQMINSMQNGTTQQYFGEGCVNVVADPARSLVNLVPFSGTAGVIVNALSPITSSYNFVSGLTTNGSGSLLCDVSWLALKKTGLGAYDTPAATDISVGSSIINNLNNYQQGNSIPMVNVWGNEQSPIHWREIENIQFTKPQDLPFNATDDEGLMNTMDNIANFYRVGSIVAGVSASALTVAGFWAPPAWGYVLPVANVGIQFYQGYYWIAEESEPQWHVMIGATTNVSVTSTVQSFGCLEQLIVNGLGWLTSLSLRDIRNCFRTNTITYQVPLMLPNDGIVSKDAALILGICEIEVQGANHQELRNHPRATDAYQLIFDKGLVCIDQFFETN